jgi:hypothetical protein
LSDVRTDCGLPLKISSRSVLDQQPDAQREQERVGMALTHRSVDDELLDDDARATTSTGTLTINRQVGVPAEGSTTAHT